jgi:hypothetical protein
VENNHRLLEGWRKDDTSHHYQTCVLALLSLAEVNVHVMKSQANRFVTWDAYFYCLCAVQFLDQKRMTHDALKD